MIAGRVKDSRIKSGDELKEALCTATGSTAPQKFDNVMLNRLLDFAALPFQDPRKDPLALKHELAEFDASLAKLTLKQRRAMMGALEKQISMCSKLGIDERFFVEGGWPPKEPGPEPARAAPKPGSQLIVSPTPLSGEGEGFTWAQSETEMTITIAVPEGTQKTEIMMQVTPKYGPAQHIVLRARFWPLPLVCGTLHHQIDASEATWHLDTNSKVIVDLPKLEPGLWKGTPPVFEAGSGPLAEYVVPTLAITDEATGSCAAGTPSDPANRTAMVVGLAPETLVQKMGQSPNDLPALLHGCATLAEVFEADGGKCLGAANARAVPVLLRVLRLYGQRADVQLAVWQPLLQIINAQPWLRKVLVEAPSHGMKLLLTGMDAHKPDASVETQLALVLRALLPATPPRPFVEAGGLEILVEVVIEHANCVPLVEVAGSCLHMLSAVNNIIRRMILRMETIPPLLALCDAHPARASLHEVVLGLTAQLGRGDASCQPLYSMQVSISATLELARRFPASAVVQAEACRAIAPLCTSERGALALMEADGLELLLEAVSGHGEESAVGNEVLNVLEQAVCAMCEAADEETPEDELDVQAMVELIRALTARAEERKAAEEAARRAREDAAREAAEEAERLRKLKLQAELDRIGEIEKAPSSYGGGFSWGAGSASFEDPRLGDGEDIGDEPRVVELDD